MNRTTHLPAREGDNLTTYAFKVVLEPDEDRWRAFVPELEHLGAATWGYSREEALTHMREVMELIVAELVEDGGPVPAPAQVSREPLIPVTVWAGSTGSACAASPPARSSPRSSATASACVPPRAVT